MLAFRRWLNQSLNRNLWNKPATKALKAPVVVSPAVEPLDEIVDEPDPVPSEPVPVPSSPVPGPSSRISPVTAPSGISPSRERVKRRLIDDWSDDDSIPDPQQQKTTEKQTQSPRKGKCSARPQQQKTPEVAEKQIERPRKCKSSASPEIPIPKIPTLDGLKVLHTCIFCDECFTTRQKVRQHQTRYHMKQVREYVAAKDSES